jgi:cytochrome P450
LLKPEPVNRDYERDVAKLMLNIAPKIIAPKGYEGRVMVHKAMTEYFALKYDTEDDVPKFTKDRMDLEREFGMAPSEMAGLEVAVIHGALSNTIPTAFWMLVYVFSNPKLVEKLRDEATAVITETGRSSQGQRMVTIDIKRLEEKCPLLYSVLQETQRIISVAELNRRVMSDTVVTDGQKSYLLKEGNTLQISHGVTHTLEEVWGPTVRDFDAERFLKAADKASVARSEDDLAIPPGAYTPFGAGKHICPGRFFASGEILGFIVPLLLGFEIADSMGSPIRVPEAAMPWITTGLGKPVSGSDLSAVIKRRAGWHDVVWSVVASTNVA